MFVPELDALRRPVAVFDTGLGSYSAVRMLRERLPAVDVLYLADRASFPYGGSGEQELRATIERTLAFLERFAPSAIVMASNAPSITAFPEVRAGRPLFGVRPPVHAALKQATTGHVGVLGVSSMVTSARMSAYVAQQAGTDVDRVHLIDASELVELVESGRFVTDPHGSRAVVERFAVAELDTRPDIEVLTLSSTHLPWVRDLIEQSRPGYTLLDPLRDVIDEIVANEPPPGNGNVVGLVTENARYPFGSFQRTMTRIGATVPLRRVTITP